MGDVSLHFNRDEFRCKGKNCCGNVGPVSERLLEALEELRLLVCEVVGYDGKGIIINSGFRCAIHNQRVGGKRNSFHMCGEAADIRVEGLSQLKLLSLVNKVRAFKEGGVGMLPKDVHVDVRRSGMARW
jgi:uncharacterized protein YcbK (DUF882 family)